MAARPELVPWRAQPGPQLEAIKKHWVPELFFGGAVGGGKSDFLLGDFAQDVPEFGPAWHGILFRKSYPQLDELVARSRHIYPQWFGLSHDCFVRGEMTWKWPNGASLKFRHMENDDAWVEYQGHSYTWIAFDELPQWSMPIAYRQMKTRLRSGHKIPNKRIRGTGNPGGVGHAWIKDYWQIDRYPLGGVLIEPDTEGGNARMFIRSKVTDNKILLESDPGYIGRLKDLGSPDLVKQYLDGDWNVVAGAFYPEFSSVKHVLTPFEIPKHWMRYRAMDWGSSAPFSVGWYAVVGDDFSVQGRVLPRGALVKYREWYGAKPGQINVGLQMVAEEVADGIRSRESEAVSMSVIDPSAFKTEGGPSIAERLASRKVFFQRADNARKSGWDMLRARLKGDDDGRPMIYFFSTCPDTIRTIPMLQHDRGKRAGSIEDVDTDSEDHAGDETRYACMARPWVRKGVIPEQPKFQHGLQNIPTFQELMEGARKRRLENQ